MNQQAISLATSLRLDPYPTPDYRVCHTRHDIIDLIASLQATQLSDYITNGGLLLSEDTESLPNNTPYCLTFSAYPGTGGLIYADDTRALNDYRDIVTRHRTHHLFHNYLHDVVPFDALSLPIHKFLDTMVMAYHLCLGGGGDDDASESKAGRGFLSLKSLAYRHCNMQMTSFKDTVYPHSIPHLSQWLTQAAEALTPLPKVKQCVCGHPTTSHTQRGKTLRHTGPCGQCDCRKHKAGKTQPLSNQDKSLASLYTKTNRLATKLVTETDTDWADPKKDPWKFIRTNWQEDVPTLETCAGPLPPPSISTVPEPSLLIYAVKDADATLRLYLFLRKLKPWLFYP